MDPAFALFTKYMSIYAPVHVHFLSACHWGIYKTYDFGAPRVMCMLTVSLACATSI